MTKIAGVLLISLLATGFSRGAIADPVPCCGCTAECPGKAKPTKINTTCKDSQDKCIPNHECEITCPGGAKATGKCSQVWH